MTRKTEPDSLISMFEKIGKEMKMPGVEVNQVIEANRKNLEALEKSARAAAKGAGDMVNRQRQLLEESMQDFAEAAKRLVASASPQDMMTKQAEFARQSFEKAVRNAGETAKLAQDAGADVMKSLRERFDEGVRELREEIKKRTA